MAFRAARLVRNNFGLRSGYLGDYCHFSGHVSV